MSVTADRAAPPGAAFFVQRHWQGAFDLAVIAALAALLAIGGAIAWYFS